MSERVHTVTAGDGLVRHRRASPGGATFARAFPAVGTFAYHCTIHPTMIGEVDVRRVFLGPAAARGGAGRIARRVLRPGRRSHRPASAIERDGGAFGYRTVATAHPGARRHAGRRPSRRRAPATTAPRWAPTRASTRRLLVIDRTVRRARDQSTASTSRSSPTCPGGVVVLQLHLRDRFGWWPAQRVRLDYLSHASFKVAGSPMARVGPGRHRRLDAGGAEPGGSRWQSAPPAQHAAERAEAPGDAREEHHQEDVRVGQVGLRVLADDLVGDQDRSGGQRAADGAAPQPAAPAQVLVAVGRPRRRSRRSRR